MSEQAERTARLESRADSTDHKISDHEIRLRKLERLTFGIIGAALVLSWVLTQTNNILKIVG